MNSGNRNFAVVFKGLLSTSLALAVFLAPFAKPTWAQSDRAQIDPAQTRLEINISARQLENLPSDMRTVLGTLYIQARSIEDAASSSDQTPEERLKRIVSLSQSIDGLAGSLNGSAGTINTTARDIGARSRAIARAIAGGEELVNAAGTMERLASSIQSSSATIGSQARAINTLASDRQSSPRFGEMIDANRIILEVAVLTLDALAAIIGALAAIYGVQAFYEQRFEERFRQLIEESRRPENRAEIRPTEERLRRLREILEGSPTNTEEVRPRNGTTQNKTSSADLNRVELFGGYSYMLEDSEPERFGLHGWNASAAYNFNRTFAIRADVSGHYRSEEAGGFSTDLRKHQLVVGPQVSARAKQLRAFLFVFAGLAHVRTETNFTGLPSPITSSDTAPAFGVGGGLDVNVSDRFFFRPFQIDYVGTRSNEAVQHNYRYSAGIGWKF